MTEQTRFEKAKNLSVSFSEETVKDVSTTSMKQSDEISMSEAPSEETIQTDVKSSPTMNESISSAIPLPLVNYTDTYTNRTYTNRNLNFNWSFFS